MPPDPPGPHHPPPTDLASRELPLRVTAEPIFRFHSATQEARYFGLTPPRKYLLRFDSLDRSFGVLYAASDPHGAFIETFGHNTGIRYVSEADLAARHLSRIEVNRPLRLVDLTGPHLAQIGCDARLCTGEFGVAQLWSQAFYFHPNAPDGILYHCRHDPGRMGVALYERAASAFVNVACVGTLADGINRRLLADILRTYRFGYGPLPL